MSSRIKEAKTIVTIIRENCPKAWDFICKNCIADCEWKCAKFIEVTKREGKEP